MNKKTKVIIICLIIILICLSGAIAYIESKKVVKNNGIIKKSAEISLWKDSGFTIPLIEYQWGEVDLETWYYKLGYVRSDANVPVNVTFNLESFLPSDAAYEWYIYIDGWGTTKSLQFYHNGESTWFNFFLKLNGMPEEIFDFSFDIVVNSTELLGGV